MVRAQSARVTCMWLAMAVALGAVGVPAWSAETTIWQGPAGEPADWFDPANWSLGVPDAEDRAEIDFGGVAHIPPGAAQANSLRVGSAFPPPLEDPFGQVWQEEATLRVRSLAMGTSPDNRYQLSGGVLLTQGTHLFGGTFDHQAGLHEAADLWVKGDAIYRLTDGELRILGGFPSYPASNLEGRFEQLGGSFWSDRDLWVANGGLYELRGGLAETDQLHVGRYEDSFLFGAGPGQWIQTGGLASLGMVTVENGSTFQLDAGRAGMDHLDVAADSALLADGGTLDIRHGLRVRGTLDLGGQARTLGGRRGIFDFTHATLLGTQNTHLALGNRSLLVVEPGQDLGALFGSVFSSGIVHTAGAPLVIESGQAVYARGAIDDYVDLSGGLTADEGHGIDLPCGLLVGHDGRAELGEGALIVSDDRSGNWGGYLAARQVTLTDDARFVHSRGESVIGELRIGATDGDQAVFDVSGGDLTLGSMTVHPGSQFVLDASSEPVTVGRISGTGQGPEPDFLIESGDLTLTPTEYRSVGWLQQSGGTVHVAGTVETSLRYQMVQKPFWGWYGSLSGGDLTLSRLEMIDGYVDLDSLKGEIHQSGGTLMARKLYIPMPLAGGPSLASELSGGTMEANYLDVAHDFTWSGGELQVVYLNVSARATLTAAPAQWRLPALSVRGTGVLTLPEGAEPYVSEKLRLYDGAQLDIASGQRMHLVEGGDLDLFLIEPFETTLLADLHLIVEGSGGRLSIVEAPGIDAGARSSGWVSNFALGTLQVGGEEGPGYVKLNDRWTNQRFSQTPEALYVDTLILNPGSRVDLNGLNLYYRNGGEPKRLVAGDADLDGRLDDRDLARLLASWGEPGGWVGGDFDASGVVDDRDLSRLLSGWGAHSAVPEPTALALLALGGLALRRRMW